MSSSFDSVYHNILQDRLSICFRIKSFELPWFQSYWCSQNVVVNNTASDSFQLSSGVAQGLVLPPVSASPWRIEPRIIYSLFCKFDFSAQFVFVL